MFGEPPDLALDKDEGELGLEQGPGGLHGLRHGKDRLGWDAHGSPSIPMDEWTDGDPDPKIILIFSESIIG
jgi:hypothetical protein